MKAYLRIQIIASVYLIIYIAALYFASGVHIGFKLDDNQLTGYIICGIMLCILISSFFAKSLIQKRVYSILFLACCFTLYGVTSLNLVSFNEAFWYFILFVDFIPFILLFETIVFWIEKR